MNGWIGLMESHENHTSSSRWSLGTTDTCPQLVASHDFAQLKPGKWCRLGGDIWDRFEDGTYPRLR